jgi:8-oxo-dGTP pyrophosphatase MutT (NUDIX family)
MGEAATPGEEAPTPVVTCFLLRRDRGRDEVLVVRRSERVRTYRGHWAGVSGYVEPGVTPEEQAHTEMREETGLGRGDVRLLLAGEPLPVQDTAQGNYWLVHPFLFLVTAPDRIQTDWEARESRWIEPSEVLALQTVPGLAAALALVYPPGHAAPSGPDGEGETPPT